MVFADFAHGFVLVVFHILALLLFVDVVVVVTMVMVIMDAIVIAVIVVEVIIVPLNVGVIEVVFEDELD